MLEPDHCSATRPAARELELKFAVSPAQRESLLCLPLFASAGRVEALRSTYFDTSDHDLKAAGFSLRVRAADVAAIAEALGFES